MLKKKKNFGRPLPDSDIVHYLKFAAVPLAAVILIAVIMAADSGKKEETASVPAGETLEADGAAENGISEGDGSDGQIGEDGMSAGTGQDTAPQDGEIPAEGESTAGSDQPAETDGSEDTETVSYADIDISQYTLKQDEVPELSALVHTYCQAREDYDVELLARLYGITGLSEAEIAEEKEKLELVHASIRRYENMSCYSIEGPEPDSYVMFPYFELKYREAEVNMPQLTWAYAVKNEDGSYIMTQEVSRPVADYIARIAEKDDVKALIAQVEEAKAAAVEADEKLRSIYGSGSGSEVVIS